MMSRSLATLVLGVAVALSLPLTAQLQDPSPAKLETAARLLGVAAERITEPELATKHFKNLGLTVVVVKAVDRTTGECLSTVQDAAGNRYEFPVLLRAEIAARRATPSAKIDYELAAAMARGEGRLLPAIAWLDFDSAALDSFLGALRSSVDPRALSREDLRAFEERLGRYVMAANAAVVDPFVAFLKTRGLTATAVSTTAPVVFFAATPAALREIAESPAVDTLYLQTADRADHNIDANATHRTDRVHEMGIKGLGIRVAMFEDNGIDPACPHLNVAGWFNAATVDPDNHIHGTSGCVASSLSTRPGSAPDVSLYSANATTYSDADVTAAGDWIAGQNIDITNMSWGPTSPTGNLRYIDRYIDYQARFYADSFVASAGNNDLGGLVGNVAWNMVVVGSHTDNDEGDWDGDVMSSFSSTGNPSTNCEKPNVAANGQDVDTLGQAPTWLTDDYDGTSFSAPHCTGNMANALSVNATLVGYPEAAMAAVMATAWHNIEGATRLSDQDGAGGIHGLALARLAMDNRAVGTTLTPASFTATGYYTYSMYLKGGDRTRAVLAWFSNANAAYTTDTLEADLDITILAGQNVTTGTSYGSSSSSYNNFEIVEFTPPTTGWYTMRVNDWSFTGTSEGIGIAWSQKYEDTSHIRLRPWSSESSSFVGPTIGNSSYFLDPAAATSPSAPFVCAPSATMANGTAFSSQTWLPIDIDAVTQLWLDTLASPILWFNSVGTLNSSGISYSNRFAIPDEPVLVGVGLYHMLLTGGAAWPDTIKEISEVNSLTFWPHPVTKTLSDDGYFLQSLPFGFRFYGVDYTQCYVNANGNITFGAADSDYTETAAEFLANRPKIAFLWTDMNPSVSGSQGTPYVRVREVFTGARELVLEYINVTQYGATDASTARVTLGDDNSIRIEYLDVAVANCLVGITPGAGLSTAVEKNLSSAGYDAHGTNVAVFELFGDATDTFDLGSPNIYFNSVRFVPTSSGATGYRLLLDVVH